jgi:hypothetical protein
MSKLPFDSVVAGPDMRLEAVVRPGYFYQGCVVSRGAVRVVHARILSKGRLAYRHSPHLSMLAPPHFEWPRPLGSGGGKTHGRQP